MAYGKLAALEIPATTKTTVYTVPTCRYADIGLSILNISNNEVTVKVYFTKDAVPGNVDLVCFNVVVPANGGSLNLEDKLSPGEKIVLECSATGIVTRVSGVLHNRVSGE